MKNKFGHFYPHTDKEFNILWSKGLIVLDANVLLNLYRYSDQTRQHFCNILRSLKHHLWIPHQAALEFHRNRLPVIQSQIQKYDSFMSSFEDLLKQIDARRGHPFIPRQLRINLQGAFDEVASHCSETEELLANYFTSDPVLETITELFSQRVGEPLPPDAEARLHEEGEQRYRDKVPPGFADRKKDGHDKFGDLVLWKQVLIQVKARPQPVILVTDDAKTDWWYEVAGRTIGPHPHLAREITELSGYPFHMYSSDRFMKFASDYTNRKIDQRTLKEIRETRVPTKLTFDDQGATVDPAVLARTNNYLVSKYADLKDLERQLQVVDQEFIAEKIPQQELDFWQQTDPHGHRAYPLPELRRKRTDLLEQIASVHQEIVQLHREHKVRTATRTHRSRDSRHPPK